ncbi:hypothetical protein [Desulfarculus baarsii]
MKLNKIVAFFAFMTLALLPVAANAAKNPFVMPDPPFDTAKVQYKLGGAQKGTEVLYIDGKKRATHTDASMSMFGMSTAQKTIVITTPDKIVNIDLEKGEGTETGNMLTYMAQEYDKLSAAEQATVRKNAEKMGRNLMGMMPGGQIKTSKGTLMGKPVDIVSAMGITTYSWSGADVMLKTQGSLGPMQVDTQAVSLETDVAIPADAFAIPAGVKVTFDQQADDMQRTMAKNWINNLKDPNFGKNGGNSGMGAVFGAPTGQQGHGQPAPGAYGSSGEHGDQQGEPGADEAMEQGMKVLQGLFGN